MPNQLGFQIRKCIHNYNFICLKRPLQHDADYLAAWIAMVVRNGISHSFYQEKYCIPIISTIKAKNKITKFL
jgi:hypothetical protein